MQICDVSFTSQQNPLGCSIYPLTTLNSWWLGHFGVALSFVHLGGVPTYSIDTEQMLVFLNIWMRTI